MAMCRRHLERRAGLIYRYGNIAMLGRLIGRKRESSGEMVIVQLNAKLQPIHSGEYFEDPLDGRL